MLTSRGCDSSTGAALEFVVSNVCAVAVLDRAGVRPIDFDPAEEKAEPPKFDPRAYTREELDVIEAGLRLIMERRRE